MKRRIPNFPVIASVLALILMVRASTALCQGTVFTYQGVLLKGGQVANGTNYSMVFYLYDAPTNGNLLGNAAISNVAASNGLFTVSLDFGNVFDGSARWLEVSVENSGDSGFTVLYPLQEILPTPYAITAGNVVSGGLSAGVYGNAITFSNSANQFSGTYSGNGSGLTNVAGSLTPQTVAGTVVSAASNMSYLLTNNSLVSVTLPASPNPGDIIRVADSGYGGWQLLQNPGQTVLAVNLVAANGDWTQVVTNRLNNHWYYLVSSPDGLHLIAVGVNVLESQDGGLTWTAFPGLPLAPVCESADGTQAAQAEKAGPITFVMSTNLTVAFQTNLLWSGIVCSANFSYLAATVNGGGIYYSSDYGTNWELSDAPATNWVAIAASQDGSRMAAALDTGSNNGAIYISSDFGTNWSATTAPTNVLWTSIASSADGSHLVAAATSSIYTSPDSGMSWDLSSSLSNGWVSVASSADGTHLIAGPPNNGTFPIVSTDSGTTWMTTTLPSGGSWYALASTAAGTFIAGDYSHGGIYIYKTATTTGTTGYLSGGPNTAITLEYMGNGVFLPVSHEGNLLPY